MSSFRPPERRLYKSRRDRKIAGVCGGIAEFFGLDSALVRLGFVVLLILGGGGGLIYLIAAIILDDNPYD